MSGNSVFELNTDSGWRAGLKNLLGAEFKLWWKTRRWWTQLLIWIGIVDLFLIMIIFAESSEGTAESLAELPELIMIMYSIMGGMFVTVGVIILMQSAIVGEKITGTAAWVLSKPASRSAFVISKLIANAFGVAITAILVPGLIAFTVINYGIQDAPEFLNFLGGMGIFLFSSLFWLVFTLVLGAFYNSRGPVIGIPLGLMLGQQFVVGLIMKYIPWMYDYLPYQLVMPLNGSGAPYTVAIAVIQGTPVLSWTPVFSTLVLIVALTALGIWRFSREEF